VEDKAVIYERDGEIAVITLNRPEKRNALSEDVRNGIRDSFARFEADEAAKVAVLTGAGKSFCAGADLGELAKRNIHATGKSYTPILQRNMFVSKPVIAAVNGHALGGGFLQAQMCDLVIASSDASFGMPEAKWGRGAPWSVPLLWMIPQRVWLEMALTGQPIDAQRAYEIGLVNQVVSPEELLKCALSLGRVIATGAPLTIQATMKMVRLSKEMGLSPAWDVAEQIFAGVYASADAIEGPRAFVEGRAPSWIGDQSAEMNR
jgi:enoyl-CoA hydratase